MGENWNEAVLRDRKQIINLAEGGRSRRRTRDREIGTFGRDAAEIGAELF